MPWPWPTSCAQTCTATAPLPADSDKARAITVLARAQQDAVWNRQQIANQIRSLLREYYPAALDAFHTRKGGLSRPDARKVLTMAPTPDQAARLTLSQLRAGLKRAGRSRNIDTDARQLHTLFRTPRPRQPAAVERAMGQQLLALLIQLDAACQATDDLTTAVAEHLRTHPDAEILLSFPGLGPQLAARILAEIGDDRARFTSARGLKAYAGSAPITRSSGKKRYIGRRYIKNDRLCHAGHLWAFASLSASPGAKAHYQRRRAHGDWNAAAQRHLFNRLIGQLYHCLQTRQPYNEDRAFPPPPLDALTP